MWERIGSGNPNEESSREICRRADSVGILSNRDDIIHPVRPGLAEKNQWAEGGRYLGLDVLARCSLSAITSPTEHEANGAQRLKPPQQLNKGLGRYTTPRVVTGIRPTLIHYRTI